MLFIRDQNFFSGHSSDEFARAFHEHTQTWPAADIEYIDALCAYCGF